MDPSVVDLKELAAGSTSLKTNASDMVELSNDWKIRWRDLLHSDNTHLTFDVSCSSSNVFDGSSEGRLTSQLNLNEVNQTKAPQTSVTPFFI